VSPAKQFGQCFLIIWRAVNAGDADRVLIRWTSDTDGSSESGPLEMARLYLHTADRMDID
jgi:hypothetical protein